MGLSMLIHWTYKPGLLTTYYTWDDPPVVGEIWGDGEASKHRCGVPTFCFESG